MRKSLLIVVSGPSGAGKGTVCAELMRRQPQIVPSISCTTRDPRPGDAEGKTYFFKTMQEFESMIQEGAFLEHAAFYAQRYGTPRAFVEQTLDRGNDCLLEIDPQGARQVMANMPEAVSVYLLPPSMKELYRRLSGRGTENPEKIAMRFSAAKAEMANMHLYNYCVVNDSVGRAADVIESILIAERHRAARQLHHWDRLKEEEV